MTEPDVYRTLSKVAIRAPEHFAREATEKEMGVVERLAASMAEDDEVVPYR